MVYRSIIFEGVKSIMKQDKIIHDLAMLLLEKRIVSSDLGNPSFDFKKVYDEAVERVSRDFGNDEDRIPFVG